MKTRPLGITILSVLSIIGGIAILVMQIVLFKNLTDTEDITGVSSIGLIVNLSILGVWGLVGGIGMWMGKKWGWWLGATYLSYSVLRNANALRTIFSLMDQYPIEDAQAEKYFQKYTWRVIIHSLICIYYFKNNVLEFFGHTTERKLRKVMVYLGITILIVVVMGSITALL